MAASIEEVIRVLQLTTTRVDDETKTGEGGANAYKAGLAELFHQAQDALASGGEVISMCWLCMPVELLTQELPRSQEFLRTPKFLQDLSISCQICLFVSRSCKK